MSCRRTLRILGQDGRALILAMDHRRVLRVPALDGSAVHDLLRAAVDAGVEAAMVTLSVAATWGGSVPRLPLIASISAARPHPSAVVEAALRHDCQALKYEVFPGTDTSDGDYGYLEALTLQAQRHAMPVMAEVIPGGFDQPNRHTAEAIAHGCTIAFEAGASLLKVPSPIDGGLDHVVRSTELPTFILGGPQGSSSNLVESIAAAIQSGASGAVIGRRIFESDDPTATMRQIVRVVHNTGTP